MATAIDEITTLAQLATKLRKSWTSLRDLARTHPDLKGLGRIIGQTRCYTAAEVATITAEVRRRQEKQKRT